MTEPTYRSTILSPGQLVLGVLSGLAAALVLVALSSGLWPAAIVAFLATTGVAYYLAPITVTIADARLTIAQGRGEKEPRVVYVSEIRSRERRDLSPSDWLGAVLGIGSVDDTGRRTTRLAVRPGQALQLTLTDGEQILLSVRDADAALQALGRRRPPAPRPPIR